MQGGATPRFPNLDATIVLDTRRLLWFKHCTGNLLKVIK